VSTPRAYVLSDLGALANQFSELDALEGHVNDLLAKLIPRTGANVDAGWLDLVALPSQRLLFMGVVEVLRRCGCGGMPRS
jgi:hypothetical protein